MTAPKTVDIQPAMNRIHPAADLGLTALSNSLVVTGTNLMRMVHTADMEFLFLMFPDAPEWAYILAERIREGLTTQHWAASELKTMQWRISLFEIFGTQTRCSQ